MQRQVLDDISLHTLEIFSHLMNHIHPQNTLKSHIEFTFNCFKAQLNQTQFQCIFKPLNHKHTIQSIDQVFSQLDINRNEIIQYDTVQKVYQLVCKEAGLNTQKGQAVQNYKEIDLELEIKRLQSKDQQQILLEVRLQLSQKQYIVEIMRLFNLIHQGQFTEDNILELLEQLNCQNKSRRILLIGLIMEGRETISYEALIFKLNLQNLVMKEEQCPFKISLRERDFKKQKDEFYRDQVQQNESQSQFWNVKYTKEQQQFLKGSYQFTMANLMAVEQTSLAVREYMNKDSELDQVFAGIVDKHLNKGVIFNDRSTPTYSKTKRWMHLASEFHSYQIFQNMKNILSRQQDHQGHLLLLSKDIKQGDIGDCYFLSAVIGIAEKYPEMINRLFVLDKNPSYIFGVRGIVLYNCQKFEKTGKNDYEGKCSVQKAGAQNKALRPQEMSRAPRDSGLALFFFPSEHRGGFFRPGS